MKYWYLEKYRNIKITELTDLKETLNFFLVVPKYTKKEGNTLLDKNIEELKEEEIIILINYILYYKKSSLNKLIPLIDKLLIIPDNSMPLTDYSLLEMLTEIKKLKTNKPTREKLETNNIAACYNCFNIFYIDKINYINKKGLCLCPYCKSTNVYFDNDYIPMDYFFLRLSHQYYKETELGCTFKNLQKLLKKSINYQKSSASILLKKDILENSNIFNKTITSKEEMYLFYEYYRILEKYDISYNFDLTIEVPELSTEHKEFFSNFLIIFITSLLGKNPYLKKVFLDFKDTKDITFYKKNFNNYITFS